jgi:hypothetical protein
MKIGVIASLLLLAIAMPALSIPRAHAFDRSISQPRLTSLVMSDSLDGFYGTFVDAAREGSTVSFNVQTIASNFAGQRNITVGVKMDWMNNFVNATTASSTNTLALTANQIAVVAAGVTMPALSGSYSNINLVTHNWELRVWSGKLNLPITDPSIDCPNHGALSGCSSFRNFVPFAIYSNAQADGQVSRQQSGALISSLQGTLSGLTQLPPGAAKASSELAQASAEQRLGDTSYGQGDFAGAKTHYTNALNLANSAASDLAAQGGGVDSANFWRLLLAGTGELLVGVGVFVAAVAAWLYLHRRSKTVAKTA